MSGADLQMHEGEAAARSRQHMAWMIVLCVIGVLLVARAFVGTTVGPMMKPGEAVGSKGPAQEYRGFGIAYVEVKDHTYVAPSKAAVAEYESKKEAQDAKPKSGATDATKAAPLVRPTWVEVAKDAVPAGTPADDVRSWKSYEDATPGEFVRAHNLRALNDAPPITGQVGAPVPTFEYSWPRTAGIWLAAFFTLAVLSFLVKDNPAYKFTESVVVGVSAAYWMTVAFWDTLVPKLIGQLAPGFTKANLMPALEVESTNWILVAPLILGIMLLCRLNRKVAWLGIYPLAFIVGTYAGLRFVNFTESDLLQQIATMFEPLIVIKETVVAGVGGAPATSSIDWAGTVGGSIRALLVFGGVLSVLVYFFFSLEHKGVAGKTARVGIWFLMITFGASFGLTVMGRIALLAARFEFLFDDWLWLVDPSNKH